jgi:hypothetical protein
MQATLEPFLRDDYESRVFTPEFLEVIRLFERYRGDTFRFLKETAVFLAKQRGEVSADDLQEVVSYFNIEGDRRIIGAALGDLYRKGILVKLYERPTGRREAHGRKIGVYGIPGAGKNA